MSVTAPNPLPDWCIPAFRIGVGLSPRLPRPAGMPKPAPKWFVQELETWNVWNAWKNAGGHPPHPPIVWLTQTGDEKWRAPKWAKTLRGEWLGVHVIPPAPHDPERKTSRWTLDEVGGFGLRIEDHMLTQGSLTPEELVARFANAREPHTGKFIRYLSIEGYPASDGTMFEGYSVDNEPYMDRFIKSCHAVRPRYVGDPGLQARLWERTDMLGPVGGFAHIKRILTDHPGFDVYEADLEEMDKTDPTIADQFATDPLTKDMPRVTLYAGMADAHYYAPWIAADFAAGTQAYSHEDWPNGRPVPPGIALAMDNDCKWRGCSLIEGLNGLCSIPMLGVNVEGDHGLEHQLPSVEAFDGNYGIEWASTLNADDLKLIGVS